MGGKGAWNDDFFHGHIIGWVVTVKTSSKSKDHTRWAQKPVINGVINGPYKWPYNWVTGVITLLLEVISPLLEVG